MSRHHVWDGADTDGTLVSITPEDAGWDWCGLSVVTVPAGGSLTVETGPSELFVLPLAGGVSLAVSAAGSAEVEATHTLAGRESVFTGVSDFAYVGRDSTVTLTSDAGATLALPSAVCHHRLESRYGAADAVPVEVRGAGPATRLVRNFGIPDVWDHAEKIICCELITPPGNWSSYPPHKHDASAPCEVINEEIYYYRIAGPDQVTPSRVGSGFHRTYTGPEHADAGLTPINDTFEVRDHDVVLIPHGYHGPCVAAPGYPMYYLNVMAGPADDRRLAFCDDPDHTWIRDSWADQPIDPRVEELS